MQVAVGEKKPGEKDLCSIVVAFTERLSDIFFFFFFPGFRIQFNCVTDGGDLLMQECFHSLLIFQLRPPLSPARPFYLS